MDAYFLGEVNLNEIVCSVSDNIFTRYSIGDGSDIRQEPIDIQHLARPMALLRLVRQWNLNYAKTGAQVPLFVKSHGACDIANGVEMLPWQLTKAVVHIVRDPRDAFLSFEKHMGFNDRELALKAFTDKYRCLTDKNKAQVGDFISSWSHNTSTFVNNGTHNVFHVRFEDLKKDPQKWFESILNHAGVKPDPEKVAKAIEMVSIEKLRKKEESGGFIEASPHTKFFGKGEVGGWKGKLSPRDENRIIKECGSMMKHFGYIDRIKRVA